MKCLKLISPVVSINGAAQQNSDQPPLLVDQGKQGLVHATPQIDGVDAFFTWDIMGSLMVHDMQWGQKGSNRKIGRR